MRYFDCFDGYYGHGITNGMNYFDLGGLILIGIGVIILSVLVTLLIVKGKKKNHSLNEAEEMLKLRYAKGEISEEDYKKMKKLL